MDRSGVTVLLTVLMALFLREAAGQPEMQLPASQIVLGSTAPVDSIFTCRIDSGITIETIFSMQILRMRDSLDTELDPVVQATSSGVSFVSTAPTDMLERGSPGGGLDTATLTSSTLTLTLTTEDIVCSDKGTYQCQLVYQNSQNEVLTLVHNATMDTYALPHDVTLTARENNVVVQGTEANPQDVNVNDAVEFTCTAMIGSNNNTRIRWRRTSAFGTTNVFNQYNPSAGTYSDGTSSATTTDCSYSRTATMTYNVTSVETSRNNDLAFQCYVEVTVNGVTYTTQNPPEFYIKPVSTSTGGGTGSSTGSDTGTAGSGNIAAIIGGIIGGLVLIAIIVTIVWWLKARGGDGSSYRTKEETGGSNPNLVDNTYASVDKSKNHRSPQGSTGYKPSYDNDGLDKDHSRRHYQNQDHFNDSRYGRSNRGMDEDDYSQDGSPTINHMGMDPENGGYGTGV